MTHKSRCWLLLALLFFCVHSTGSIKHLKCKSMITFAPHVFAVVNTKAFLDKLLSQPTLGEDGMCVQSSGDVITRLYS